MQFILRRNTTDVSIIMALVSPTTNGPLTGATITDLDMTYTRPGSAAVKADATARMPKATTGPTGRMPHSPMGSILWPW